MSDFRDVLFVLMLCLIFILGTATGIQYAEQTSLFQENGTVIRIAAHQEHRDIVAVENVGEYIPEVTTLILEYDGYETVLDLYHPGDKGYIYLNDDERTVVIRVIDIGGNEKVLMEHTFWSGGVEETGAEGQVRPVPEIEEQTFEVRICEDGKFMMGSGSSVTACKLFT